MGGKNYQGGHLVPQGYAINVSTAMKDAMEAENWAPELRVCCQPRDALPSDTRPHCLVVALLGGQVHMNAPLHARLWDDHQHVLLNHLQGKGVRAPTIVWLSGQPMAACWQLHLARKTHLREHQGT